MITNNILQEAAAYQEQLVQTRRYLHSHPETGFDLKNTTEYVRKELIAMGYEPDRKSVV